MPGGDVMALVKPQFEAGKENVGKKGIVREPKIHLAVLRKNCKNGNRSWICCERCFILTNYRWRREY